LLRHDGPLAASGGAGCRPWSNRRASSSW
jgi:hypothetical protein